MQIEPTGFPGNVEACRIQIGGIVLITHDYMWQARSPRRRESRSPCRKLRRNAMPYAVTLHHESPVRFQLLARYTQGYAKLWGGSLVRGSASYIAGGGIEAQQIVSNCF
jgi:hypothetical protein